MQHSAWATTGAPTPDQTDFNLERVIPKAQRLSAAGQGAQRNAPILARLDSGFDSERITRGIEACNRPGLAQVDWLIKWNPRSTMWPRWQRGSQPMPPRTGRARARASA